MSSRPGRNDLCHCGSGGKYKRCCLDKDDAARSAELAAQASAAAAAVVPGDDAARSASARDARRGPGGASTRPQPDAKRSQPPTRRRSV